jgi:hypothetical protein
LSSGGTGGQGGGGGIYGGGGGQGQGPTVNFSGVQNLTNNMYVGEGPLFLSPKLFLNNSSVNQGQGLIKYPVLNIFEVELCLDSKKFCSSGWSLLLIRRTNNMNCGNFITEPLGAGS